MGIVLAMSALASGCLAGTGSFDFYDVPRVRHTALPPSPPPPNPPVRLARRHEPGARYRRDATAWIGLVNVADGMRIRLAGDVAVTPTDEGYAESVRITEAEAEGAAVYMNPEPATPYLVGAELSMRFDHRNRPITEPTAQRVDWRADTLVLEVARVIFGRLRIPHPPLDARPGDAWDGDPIRMDTRGAGGWVTLTLRPRFELERIEDGRAVVRWRGGVDTEPFCQLGPCLRGAGHLHGVSRIDLVDGFGGRTDLIVKVAVRGRDARADAPPILEIEARFTDERRAIASARTPLGEPPD